MIGQQLVDPPQANLAERRRKQVRMNVNERRRSKHVFYFRMNLLGF